MIGLTVLALLGVLVLDAQPLQQAGQPLTVCELLVHRQEYADKILTVRGEIKTGPHGAWLTAGPKCEYRILTKGVTWENEIWLQYPNNRSSDPAAHADFQVDWPAEETVNFAIKELGFDPQKDQLFETVTGLFRTYPDLDRRVNPGLPAGSFLRTLGFGPNADAPAKLLIKATKDPVVVHSAAKGN